MITFLALGVGVAVGFIIGMAVFHKNAAKIDAAVAAVGTAAKSAETAAAVAANTVEKV
jgi:hypothetical protein